MDNRLTLTVTKTRHYGKVDMTFGASQEFLVTATHTMNACYAELQKVIDTQFDEYETVTLKSEIFDTAGQPAPSASSVFAGIEVVKRVDGSKTTYAIKTQETKFAKHGAAIYEALDKYPVLKAAVDNNGSYKFKAPLQVRIDLSGNHPRVLEIIGAS